MFPSCVANYIPVEQTISLSRSMNRRPRKNAGKEMPRKWRTIHAPTMRLPHSNVWMISSILKIVCFSVQNRIQSTGARSLSAVPGELVRDARRCRRTKDCRVQSEGNEVRRQVLIVDVDNARSVVEG